MKLFKKSFVLRIGNDEELTKTIDINTNQCKTIEDFKKKVSEDFRIDEKLFSFENPPKKDFKDVENNRKFIINMKNPSTTINFLLPDASTIFPVENNDKLTLKDIKNSLKEAKICYTSQCIDQNFNFFLFGIKIPYKDSKKLPNLPPEIKYEIKLTGECVSLQCYNKLLTFSENAPFKEVSSFIKEKFDCNINDITVKILRNEPSRFYLKSADNLKPGDIFDSIQINVNLSFFIKKSAHCSTHSFDIISKISDVKNTIAISFTQEQKIKPEDIIFKYKDKITNKKVEITKNDNDKKLLDFYKKGESGIFFDIDIITDMSNEKNAANKGTKTPEAYGKLDSPSSPKNPQKHKKKKRKKLKKQKKKKKRNQRI